MLKIPKTKAIKYGREGLTGYNYALPDIDGGTTVLYAKLTGEHGERTIGDKPRIYFILEGTAKFMVDGKRFNVKPYDVIPIKHHQYQNKQI